MLDECRSNYPYCQDDCNYYCCVDSLSFRSFFFIPCFFNRISNSASDTCCCIQYLVILLLLLYPHIRLVNARALYISNVFYSTSQTFWIFQKMLEALIKTESHIHNSNHYTFFQVGLS